MSTYKPDFEQLDKLTEEGYLSKKVSDCGKFMLYNYNDKCTFEKKWNDHTINSRGTVYEISTGKVVTRAFPKFWNLSELAVSKQRNILKQTNFTVYEKYDGSMVTLAFYDGEWKTHTRGSFNSDQAIKAKQMLSKYDISALNKEYTYILEVIYPENKIVVDYGKLEELILLAIFNTKSGEEYHLNLDMIEELGIPETMYWSKVYNFNSIDEVVTKLETLTANEEGYVVKLANGERVKLKSPEYLKVARILTRMSPLVLWESMKDGEVSKELLATIPEEFRADYESMANVLEDLYFSERIAAAARTIDVVSNLDLFGYKNLKELDKEDKKAIGLYLQNNPHEYNQFVFLVINNKSANIEEMIMRRIRPTGNVL